MRKNAAAAALGLLVAVAGGVVPAAAQAGEEAPAAERTAVEARLTRRIDALLPKARAAAERARETSRVRDSIRRAEARIETVVLKVGPLRVVTLPGQEADARRLVSSELGRVRPLAGPGARVLGDVTLVFQYAPVLEPIRVDGPSRTVAYRSYWPEEAVRRRIRDVLGAEITGATPALVRFWLGNRPIRMADDPHDLHRALVLDGSRSAAACRRGAVGACWASFGLSGSRAPVPAWYADEQVRRLANGGPLTGWLGCREAAHGPVGACDEELLRSGRDWTAAIPFDHALRADLVAFALELGGERALDRFLAGWPSSADRPGVEMGGGGGEPGMTLARLGREMQARLAAAAGVPADELMRRWRARVMGAGRGEVFDFDRARLTTGFWFLFFAALATRSTRWRLG